MSTRIDTLRAESNSLRAEADAMTEAANAKHQQASEKYLELLRAINDALCPTKPVNDPHNVFSAIASARLP